MLNRVRIMLNELRYSFRKKNENNHIWWVKKVGGEKKLNVAQ